MSTEKSPQETVNVTMEGTVIKGESPFIYAVHQPGGEPTTGGETLRFPAEYGEGWNISTPVMFEGGRGKGWIVFTEPLGELVVTPKRDVVQRALGGRDYETGKHFEDWAEKGYGVIVRLNLGYADDIGTLPYEEHYDKFRDWVRDYVSQSRGAHIWIIGNETNLVSEWPRWDWRDNPHSTSTPKQQRPYIEMITAERYAKLFKMCRAAIRGLERHEDDQVIVSGVGPWNKGIWTDLDVFLADANHQGLYNYTADVREPRQREPPISELGDWTLYYEKILKLIGPGNLEGIAIHTYSESPSMALPRAIIGDGTQDHQGGPNLTHLHNSFQTYTDFLKANPKWAKGLPVYITETNQNGYWFEDPKNDKDKKSLWVQQAYDEIDNWNHNRKFADVAATAPPAGDADKRCDTDSQKSKSESQKILALCLYRWPHDQDKNDNNYPDLMYNIGFRPKILTDFQEALKSNYRHIHLYAHQKFRDIKDRTDATGAGWIWGPYPRTSGRMERYDDAEHGVASRLVQYFDKGRMELPNPPAESPDADVKVTAGLLVTEMIKGQMQIGDHAVSHRSPAAVPTAGDLTGNPASPTYAAFTPLLEKIDTREGELVKEVLELKPDGTFAVTVTTDAKVLGYQVKYDYYSSDPGNVLGHNIPDKMYTYLQSRFMKEVAQAMELLPPPDRPHWLYLMGYPIRAAYWAKVRVNQIERWVLIQPFERRILTYTPDNTDPNKVEMGNVGLHYLNWRYETWTSVSIKACVVQSSQPGAARTSAAAKVEGGKEVATATAQPTAAATQNVSVRLRNAGLGPWTPGGHRLEPANPAVKAAWQLPDRVDFPQVVLQGAEVTVGFQFTPPQDYPGGRFTIPMRVARDGADWSGNFSSVGVAVDVAQAGREPTTYEGYLDVINCAIVWGWAWDSHRPAYEVEVEVFANEVDNQNHIIATTKLTTLKANLYRDDLRNAGKGNGKHGFIYTPPEQLFNIPRQYVITARIVGTDVDLAVSNTSTRIRGTLGAYRGRVVYEGAAPAVGVPGVTVSLAPYNAAPLSTQTDAQGWYSFERVRGGIGLRYFVTASKPYHVFRTPSFLLEDINTLGDSQTGIKEIWWHECSRPTFAISGKVLASDEATPLPVPNIAVKLKQTGQTAITSAANDASRGSYRFENLPAGEAFEVEPADEYYHFTPASIPIAHLTGHTEVNFKAARIRKELKVVIKDQSGWPVSGVDVKLTGFREQGDRLPLTPAPGEYLFEGLRKGRAYTVAFSKTHYDFNPPSYDTGNVMDNVVYRQTATRRLYTVAGRITSQSIAPESGTVISVRHTDADPSFVDRIFDIVNLEFSLTNLHGGGSYVITPVNPLFDFEPASLTVTDLSENKTGDKQLSPFTATRKTASIEGYVRDDTGRGVGGVTVKATINAHPGMGTAWDGVTSANGYYSLRVPVGLNYAVTVSRPGCSFRNGAASVLNLQPAGAQADFVGGFDMHGRVEDALGRGIGGVEVRLTPTIKATTDGGGEYTVKYLSPGTGYSLTPAKGEMGFAPPAVAVDNLNGNTEAPVLRGGYSISGRLTDEAGNYLQGVEVAVTGATRPPSVVIDAYAFYRIEGLVPGGDYVVTASRPGYICEPPKAVAGLSKNEIVNFRGGYQISGRVAALSNISMAGVTVTLFAGGQVRGTALTDAEGQYAFNYLGGGPFKVMASKAGTDVKFLPAAYESGPLTGNQIADFMEAFVVRGAVRYESGVAVPDVEMNLAGEQTATTRTDADGRFEFAIWSRKGDYTVTPLKEMHLFTPAQRSLPNLEGAGAVEFTGEQQRRISGSVRTGRIGVRGIEVQLTEVTSGVERGSPLRGRPSQVTQTGSAGKYQFIILPRKGSTYTVRPVSEVHVFAPATKTLQAENADQVNVNFECDTPPPGEGGNPL